MLSANERIRLDNLTEILDRYFENTAQPLEVTPQDIQWLAFQLRLADNAMARHIEGKSDNRSKEIIAEAKRILMAKYKLTEELAHFYVRNMAMMHRITKFHAAKRIVDQEMQNNAN